MPVHSTVAGVTARVIQRSAPYRAAYLSRLEAARRAGVQRSSLSCTNLAHGFAAFPAGDKLKLKQARRCVGGDRLGLQRHAVGAPAV